MLKYKDKQTYSWTYKSKFCMVFFLNCLTVDAVNAFDLHVFIPDYIYRVLSLLLSKYFTYCVLIWWAYQTIYCSNCSLMLYDGIFPYYMKPRQHLSCKRNSSLIVLRKTRTPRKTYDKIRCSERVSTSCSISGTCHVTNVVISLPEGKALPAPSVAPVLLLLL